LGESIFDTHAFARWGARDVMALFCDSTNAPNEGVSGHEIDLVDPFDLIFAEADEGAIYLATFSSSIHRIQTLLNLAQIHDRKVAVIGRSISRNVDIALRLGLLRAEKGRIVDPKEITKLPRHKQLILCSGCQGEPNAALSRMSLDNHRQFTV